MIAGSDSLVVPRVFSAHDEEVRIPDLGHVGVLFSPRVLRMIADRLLQYPRNEDSYLAKK